MVKQKFSLFIYFLSAILVLILSIFVYRIITHICYVKSNDQITISKYTGERIPSADSSKPLKIATFSNTNEDSIAKLSSADVILEFLGDSNKITYKAIFNNDTTKNINSTINLNEYFNSCMPTFNFSNNASANDNKYNKAASIFITFNEDLSSNFLYQNGEYYHYRGQGSDKNNNTPLKTSNVIVQYINDNIINDETLTTPENYGTGLLFSDGKAQGIKWDRGKNSAIKIFNQKGGTVSLMPGSTWWIFINNNSSVAYD